VVSDDVYVISGVLVVWMQEVWNSGGHITWRIRRKKCGKIKIEREVWSAVLLRDVVERSDRKMCE
jgi:hypothetical protein